MDEPKQFETWDELPKVITANQCSRMRSREMILRSVNAALRWAHEQQPKPMGFSNLELGLILDALHAAIDGTLNDPNAERVDRMMPTVERWRALREKIMEGEQQKPVADPPGADGMLAHLWQLQSEWSQATFGSDSERGPKGPLKHLAREAEEALANPGDSEEYADCFLLILDAARRAGMSLSQLVEAASAKQQINAHRKWPTNAGTDEPVFHTKVEPPAINWEQRKWEAAVAVLNGLVSRHGDCILDVTIRETAVRYATIFVAAMKEKP